MADAKNVNSPDALSALPCHGRVLYKSRVYYVIGETWDRLKFRLTTLSCNIHFYALKSACVWVKQYAWTSDADPRVLIWYSKTHPQTVGSIRAFLNGLSETQAESVPVNVISPVDELRAVLRQLVVEVERHVAEYNDGRYDRHPLTETAAAAREILGRHERGNDETRIGVENMPR